MNGEGGSTPRHGEAGGVVLAIGHHNACRRTEIETLIFEQAILELPQLMMRHEELPSQTMLEQVTTTESHRTTQ